MTTDFLSVLDGQIAAERITRFSAPLADVGDYSAPAAAGTIEVNDVDEVIRVVKLANQHNDGAHLHPFSTGRNWGLGSKKVPHPIPSFWICAASTRFARSMSSAATP